MLFRLSKVLFYLFIHSMKGDGPGYTAKLIGTGLNSLKFAKNAVGGINKTVVSSMGSLLI